MSAWTQILEFSLSDIKHVDGSSVSINTATDATETIAPAVILTTDYYLRDETNEIITDQDAESISLEGLEFTNA